MDGLLVIDKPAGITSHDVVNRVRRILGTRRVGHTGTLDPFATGVMVVLLGKATRLAQFLDKDEKEYEATIRFGFETDTGDVTGMRKSERGMRNEEIVEKLAGVEWDSVLSRFRGEIEQTPPMYSAKKVGGKKLYESARKGVDVPRKPQSVTIQKLDVIEPFGICHSTLRIRVVCSAGTYIRTLAEDIGRVVGVGAHLNALRRTRSGRFGLEHAISLDALEKTAERPRTLLPVGIAVEHLPAFVVPHDRLTATRDGLSTRVENTQFNDGESIRMLNDSGGLIAIGTFIAEDNLIKPRLVLV